MDELIEKIKINDDERMMAIAEAMRKGADIESLFALTKIDRFFLHKIAHILSIETALKENVMDQEVLRNAKRNGFADSTIARLWNCEELKVAEFRKQHGLIPVFKMVDTCAGEFVSATPYYYATYEQENESFRSDREKVVVLGSGPIRIGQGVEFDYATVHCVQTLREMGYEALVINNNPETVSTDFSISDKLYFEPLTVEDVMNRCV